MADHPTDQPSREGEHARIIHDALGRLNAAGESDAQLTEPNLVGLRCFILREVRIIQNAARDLTIECDDNEMRAQANDTRARLAASALQAAEAERDKARLEMSTEKHLRFGAEAREDALRGIIRQLKRRGVGARISSNATDAALWSLLSTQEPTR